jgi:hypothetical protein
MCSLGIKIWDLTPDPTLPPPPLVYPSEVQKVIQASKCGNISHRSQEQRKDFSTWKEWLMDLVKNSHNK